MRNISFLRTMAGALSATILCSVASAVDQPSSTGTTRHEIDAAVKKVEAAFARGDDPALVSRLLYAEDVILLGQDDAHAAKGMSAAIQEVKEWYESLGTNGQKTCKYKIVDPAVSSETTFSSFILLHCEANPPKLSQPEDLRMMYVWKKLPQGWRVALEMWAPGKF